MENKTNNLEINLAVFYAGMYKRNPKMTIQMFLTCKSVQIFWAHIVAYFKKANIFEECQATGKDFSEYANKQNIPDKFKRVLADMLLIIYSILNQ